MGKSSQDGQTKDNQDRTVKSMDNQCFWWMMKGKCLHRGPSEWIWLWESFPTSRQPWEIPACRSRSKPWKPQGLAKNRKTEIAYGMPMIESSLPHARQISHPLYYCSGLHWAISVCWYHFCHYQRILIKWTVNDKSRKGTCFGDSQPYSIPSTLHSPLSINQGNNPWAQRKE